MLVESINGISAESMLRREGHPCLHFPRDTRDRERTCEKRVASQTPEPDQE